MHGQKNIKFCSVAPHIFTTIIAVLFHTYKMCVIAQTLSTKHQITVKFTGCSAMWVFGMELASCHHSGTYNLEVAPRFLENLYNHGLYVLKCFQQQQWRRRRQGRRRRRRQQQQHHGASACFGP